MKCLARWMLVAALALLAGCASGRRMLRISPFSDEIPSPDRTNAWPAYYGDGKRHALLWPLCDWDERGFAVRPLVARDEDEVELLWPLAHVQLDDGSFRALTVYRDVASDSWGVAPLFGWGRLRYIGPVWWVDSEDGAHGFFPVYWRDRPRGVRIVAPLWWEFEQSFALAPFWWHSRTSDSQVAFPFWWKFSSEDGARSSRTLFPLWHRSDEGPWHHVITPLGGKGWSDDGDASFTNVLGPVYHSSRRGDDYRYTAVAWPLFASERDGSVRRTRLAPLWERETDSARKFEQTSILLGLGRHAVDPRGQSWRLAPLFQWADTSRHEDWLDELALFRRVSTPNSRRTGGLLFSVRSRHPDEDGEFQSWRARVLLLLRLEHESRPRVDSGLAAWRDVHAPGARFERDSAGLVFDRFLWDSLLLRGGERDGERVEHHNRIPLLWEYERKGETTEWDTLLWCLHSRADAEGERFVAGWGLYRKVRRGERTTRDVFPFLTWDESPEGSDVSFLGRVFRRSTRGDKVGGYVLFVPWGDELD